MFVCVRIYVLCNGLQDQGLNIISSTVLSIYIYSCFVLRITSPLLSETRLHIFPINCCCSSFCALYSILSGLLCSWLDVGLLLAPGWGLSFITLRKTLNDVDGGNAINSSDVFCMKQNIRLEWVYSLIYKNTYHSAAGWIDTDKRSANNKYKKILDKKRCGRLYFYAIRDCQFGNASQFTHTHTHTHTRPSYIL